MAHPASPRTPRRPAPARSPRTTPARRQNQRNWLKKCILASFGLVLALIAWGALARQFAPTSNTSLTRFDAIIVLGTPADSDGNPKPTQLARVTEAVHEYERGVAPRLILTGGAASNRFVEARVMARSAEAQGIPASALFMEPEAMDTIQNVCYSVRIMKDHGWHSAEVVAGANQLPRAVLILDSLPLEWRAHAAPPLSPTSAAYQSALTAVEVLKTARYLTWARWTEHCES